MRCSLLAVLVPLVLVACSSNIPSTNTSDPEAPETIQEPGAIVGTVRFEDRTAHRGIEIDIFSLDDTDAQGNARRVNTVTTDGFGRFDSGDVPAGAYDLVFRGNGYREDRAASVSVGIGVIVDIGLRELKRITGSLSGVAVLRDREVHAGITVVAKLRRDSVRQGLRPQQEDPDGGVRDEGEVTVAADTDEDGNFRMDNLPEGEYDVQARRDDFTPATRQRVEVMGDRVNPLGDPMELIDVTAVFLINADDPFTNSRDVVFRQVAFNQVIRMRFAENPDFLNEDGGEVDFVNFRAEDSAELSEGDGRKVVYSQFIDTFEQVSQVFRDDIVLDTHAPDVVSMVIDGGADFTDDASGLIALSVVADDSVEGVDPVSEVAEMRIVVDGDEASATWERFRTSAVITLPQDAEGNAAEGPHEVCITVRDGAGNVSAADDPESCDSIVLDSVAPSFTASPEIVVNGDPTIELVHAPVIDLAFRVEGAAVMQVGRSQALADAARLPFQSSLSWTLTRADGSSPDGSYEIFAAFFDAAGNRTDIASRQVTLDTTGGVTGRIVPELEISGEGAALRVDDGAELLAGPEGVFEIAGLTAGPHTLAVDLESFAPRTVDFVVSAGGIDDIGALPLEALRGSVRATFTLADGERPAGIEVRLFGNGDIGASEDATLLSNGDGVVVFEELLIGPAYNLEARLDGYLPLPETLLAVIAGEQTPFAAELAINPGAVSGTLASSLDGVDLSGTEVQITGVGGAVLGSAVVGEGGAFLVENLPRGQHSLRASRDHFRPLVENVLVQAGEQSELGELTLQAQTGAVQATLTLADGRRPVGIEVTVSGAANLGTAVNRSALTNSQGQALIEGVPTGSAFTVTGSKEGYLDASDSPIAVLVDQETPVSIELPIFPGTVSGSVTLEGIVEGGDLSGTTVAVDADGVDPVETLADGSYRIEGIREGVYSVTASRDRYDSEQTIVRIEAGQAAQASPLALRLSRGGVSGTANLVARADHSGITVAIQGTAFATTTSASGDFIIDRVPVDTVTLLFSKPGFVPQTATVSLQADQVVPLGELIEMPVQIGDFIIDDGRGYTNQNTVTLNFLDFQEGTTHVRYGEGDISGIEYQGWDPAQTYTHPLSEGDGTKVISAQFRRNNEESAILQASVVLDQTPPFAAAVEIDDGAAFTTNDTGRVALSLQGQDDGTGVARVVISNDDVMDEADQPFSSTVDPWFLDISAQNGGVDGEKSVFIQIIDLAGNRAEALATDTIILDATPPEISRFVIDDDAEFATSTDVVLSITATDANGVQLMRIDNQSTFETAVEEPFGELRAWDLDPGEGLRNVFVRVVDSAGNASDAVSDTITLDPNGPTGVSVRVRDDLEWVNQRDVQMELDAEGATEMILSERASFEGASWEPLNRNAVFQVSTGDGLKTIYGKFRDDAGNESLPAFAQVRLDTEAPTVANLLIDGGAAFTTDAAGSVTLTFVAFDGGSGVAQMQLGLDGDASDEAPVAFEPSRVTPLFDAAEEGERFVEVIYLDRAGNASAPARASIVRDITPPGGNAVSILGTIADDATSPTLTGTASVTVTLQSSGAVSFELSEDPDLGGAGSRNFVADADGGSTMTLPWVLSVSDGDKVLYARFEDAAGNRSGIVFNAQAITLDTRGPSLASVLLEDGAEFTNRTQVDAELSAIGADQLAVATDSRFGGAPDWQDMPADSATVQVDVGATEGRKTVYAVFRDLAGNETPVAQDSVTLDTTAPQNPSVLVDSGADITTALAVLVEVDADGADTMRVACDGVVDTETAVPFAPQVTCVLPPFSGPGSTVERQVCVEFVDLAGNVNTPAECDAITYLINSPPLFVDVPGTFPTDVENPVFEGETLRIGVCADDPDGDGITLSAGRIPEQSSLTAGDATCRRDGDGNCPDGCYTCCEGESVALFAFTPTFDQGGNTRGLSIPHVVELIADDGREQSRKIVQVNVTHVDRAPELDALAQSEYVIRAGGGITVNVRATDPDDNAIVLEAGPLPPGASFSASAATAGVASTGQFRFDPGFDQAGRYDVTVVAYDADVPSTASRQRFSIAVTRSAEQAFDAITPLRTLNGATALATGDFNTDGVLDFVAGGTNSTFDADTGEATGEDVGWLRVVRTETDSGVGGFKLTELHAESEDLPSVRQLFAEDLDKDGWTDLVQLTDDRLLTWRGHGDGAIFGWNETFDLPSSPRAALEDLDGDGIFDIVVAGSDSDELRVLPGLGAAGKGDGRFARGRRVDLSSDRLGEVAGERVVAVGDLDGDGASDVLVLQTGGQGLLLARGNGSGSFEASGDLLTGDGPVDVLVADINGDGVLDLVTANATDATISVFIGVTPAGESPTLAERFPQREDIAVGQSPQRLFTEDLNGDGIPDLAVLDERERAVFLAYGRGTGLPSEGSFAVSASIDVGVQVVDMVGADVNGDGADDLVVLDRGGNSATVLLARGATRWDGNFESLADFDHGGLASEIETRDLDQDGQLDLVARNGDDLGGALRVILAGEYEDVVFGGGGGGGGDNTAGGVFVDGLTCAPCDVAEQCSGNAQCGFVQRPQFNEEFAVCVPTCESDADCPSGFGCQDSNAHQEGVGGPNTPRSVVGCFHFGEVFECESRICVPQPFGCADFNICDGVSCAGDEFCDPFTGSCQPLGFTGCDGRICQRGTECSAGRACLGPEDFCATDEVQCNPEVGLGTRASGIEVGVVIPDGANAMEIDDVDGDGIVDFLVLDGQRNLLRVLPADTASGLSWSEQGTSATDQQPQLSVLRDLDGDGLPDAVIANLGSSTVTVMRNQSAEVDDAGDEGYFATAVEYAVARRPASLVIADLNGDAILDIASAGEGGITLLIGQGTGALGNGQFTVGSTLDYDAPLDDLQAADLDGDGWPELIAIDASRERIVIWDATGSGAYAATTRSVPPLVTPQRLIAAYLDGDAHVDLLVGGETVGGGGSFAVVLLGRGTGGFFPAELNSIGSAFGDLAVMDIDGDGAPDLAAGDTDRLRLLRGGLEQSNDRCDGALALPMGGSVAGSTREATDDYLATCAAGARGRDVVYSLTSGTTAQTVTLELEATFNGALYLQTRCGDRGAQIGCNDDSAEGPQKSVVADIAMPANTTYFVIVDAPRAESSGDFTLRALVEGDAIERPACFDGVDNDNDGATDFPDDIAGCRSFDDDDETTFTCDNDIDDDGDGAVDFPDDPGCSSLDDNDETNAACNDELDDDGDGFTDYPADPGCSGPDDDDETNALCFNGIDDDGDGIVDWPHEPGCDSPTDNDEQDPLQTPACADGANNDNDASGLIDYPADLGCLSAAGRSETEGECAANDVLATFSAGVASADTAEANHRRSPRCDAINAAPEVFIPIRLTGVGRITAATDPERTTTRPVLSLLDDCSADAQSELTCAKGDTDSPTDVSIETAELPAGVYYLVVDGQATWSGDVVLDIEVEIIAGQPCDPALDYASCEGGSSCVADNGRLICKRPACADGIDNDGDGLVDLEDVDGCEDLSDNSEGDPLCANDIDDDGDGRTDLDDPGCQSPFDDDETDPAETPECADTVDNDGDQSADFGVDQGCAAAGSDAESGCGRTAQALDITDDGIGQQDTTFLPDRFVASCSQTSGAEVGSVCGPCGPGGTCDGSQLCVRHDSWFQYFGDSGVGDPEIGLCVPPCPRLQGCGENARCRNVQIELSSGEIVPRQVCVPNDSCGGEICGQEVCGPGTTCDYARFRCVTAAELSSPSEAVFRYRAPDAEQLDVTVTMLDEEGRGTVYIRNQCLGSERKCEPVGRESGLRFELDTTTSTDDDFYIFVELEEGRPGPVEVQVREVRRSGAACDPEATHVLCRNSSCRDVGGGVFQCAPFACADGIDNDNDGSTDAAEDRGCSGETDDDETDPACLDGVDNDGDGNTDYPADRGCSSAEDDNEVDPICNDGVDNDADGNTDYPSDPGCDDAEDGDETSPGVLPACADGVDNDGDGLTDYPAEPACESAAGISENTCPPGVSVVDLTGVPLYEGDLFDAANVFGGTCHRPRPPEGSLGGPCRELVQGGAAGDSECDAGLECLRPGTPGFEIVYPVCAYSCNPDTPFCPIWPTIGDSAECVTIVDGFFGQRVGACRHQEIVTIAGHQDPFANSWCEDQNCGSNEVCDYQAGGCVVDADRLPGRVSGAEQVFSYTLDRRASSLTFSTEDNDTRVIGGTLYLRTECADPRSEDACQVAGFEGPEGEIDFGRYESGEVSLRLDNPEPGTYFVVYDSAVSEGDVRSFKLRVTKEGFEGDPCERDNAALGCIDGLVCGGVDGGAATCHVPLCRDGIDNDSDGLTDYPEEIGCVDADDDSERDPPVLPACSDGVDNDLNGLADYPLDPGCDAAADLDESSCGGGVEIIDITATGSASGTLAGTPPRSVAACSARPVSSPAKGEQCGACPDGLCADPDAACLPVNGVNSCLADCSRGQGCGSGFICSSVFNGRYCVPETGDCTQARLCEGVSCAAGEACDPRTGRCGAPALAPAAGTGCSECDRDSDCDAGLICAQSEATGDRFCTLPCEDDTACWTGFTCGLQEVTECVTCEPGAGECGENAFCGDIRLVNPDAEVEGADEFVCIRPCDAGDSDCGPFNLTCSSGGFVGDTGGGDDRFCTPVGGSCDGVHACDVTSCGAGELCNRGTGACEATATRSSYLYLFRLEGDASLEATTDLPGTNADTVITIRNADCRSADDCADDTGTLGGTQRIAGETDEGFILQVSAYGPEGGDFALRVRGVIPAGSPCQPGSPVLVCEAGTICRDVDGSFICRGEHACKDGIDDDGDGRIDFPDDPGCDSPDDPDESDDPACGDGTDNDGDGATDFPDDPGCSDLRDSGEADPQVLPACANGVDDDDDGLLDYPEDPGCASASDNDEDRRDCFGLTGILDITAAGRAQGTTVGASNDFTPSCRGTSDAPDQVYFYRAPDDAELVISTIDALTGLDTVVTLLEGCGSADETPEPLACADGTPSGGVGASLVRRPVGGGDYLVVVDGYAQEEGEFRLRVREERGTGRACDPFRPQLSCLDGLSCRPVPLTSNDFACLPAACNDGLDNDGDGLVDAQDPGCNGADPESDDDESNGQCNDGIDNDGDGFVDFDGGALPPDLPDDQGFVCFSFDAGEIECHPDDSVTPGCIRFEDQETELCSSDGPDPQCSGPDDASERVQDCSDGADNDGDGNTDFPDDPGCTSPNDPSEITAACGDGLDNDGDGRIDFPEDPACTSADAASESEPACADGVDNDGDGRTDYPEEPGCAFPMDPDETDPPQPPACSDGVDDDGDSFADWPSDPDCIAAADVSERICDGGQEVTLLRGGSVAGNVLAAGDDLTSSCVSDPGGGDAVYVVELTVPAALGLSFSATTNDTVDGNDPDNAPRDPGMVVSLRSGCTDGDAELACVTFDEGNAVASTPVLPAGRYFVVIDESRPGSGGNFELTVNAQIPDGGACDPESAIAACAGGGSCELASANEGFRCVRPACNNGIDDDMDGNTDFPDDAGCSQPSDPNERQPECDDGVDNDGDGLTDFPAAPGCETRFDTSEALVGQAPQCADDVDNDGDGLFDWPADPQCTAASVDLEQELCGATPVHAWPQSGTLSLNFPDVNNRFGDGMSEHNICFPQDPPAGDDGLFYRIPMPGADGQQLELRPSFGPAVAFQVQTGCGEQDIITSTCGSFDAGNSEPLVVNVDGPEALVALFRIPGFGDEIQGQLSYKILLPQGSPCDPTNPNTVCTGANNVCAELFIFGGLDDGFRCRQPACSDGQDNDGDGLEDDQDPNCTSPTDVTESPAACSDGVDNDGDGNTDYPTDPGCSDRQDEDEASSQGVLTDCSDGQDDDGDGLTDFPADPGCRSAGSPAESFRCGVRTAEEFPRGSNFFSYSAADMRIMNELSAPCAPSDNFGLKLLLPLEIPDPGAEVELAFNCRDLISTCEYSFAVLEDCQNANYCLGSQSVSRFTGPDVFNRVFPGGQHALLIVSEEGGGLGSMDVTVDVRIFSGGQCEPEDPLRACSAGGCFVDETSRLAICP